MRSTRSELEPQGYTGGRNCSRTCEQERTSDSEVVNLIAQSKRVCRVVGGGDENSAGRRVGRCRTTTRAPKHKIAVRRILVATRAFQSCRN
jgi:hypothetical protein